MSQSSSNSNMPRSTVETLKQIQKQGLSVSIISAESGRSFSLDPSVSRETRSKQNVVVIDKSARASPRPPTVQDSKTSLLQNRLASMSEPRVTAGHSTVTSSQSTFLDKTTGNVSRTSQPSASASESKPFVTQSWSNPNSSTATENKSQASSTRMVQNIQGFPENKNQGRLSQNVSTLSENKTQASRNLQPENKVPRETRPKQGLAVIDKSRASPRPPSVQEGKASVMQCRITSISEPRASSGHSSVTTSQSSFLEKGTGSVNRTNQPQPSSSESKPFVTQSWSNPNGSTTSENKSQGTSNRIMQNVSGFPENKSQGNLVRLVQSAASSESKSQANRNLQTENKVAPGAKISEIPTKSPAAFAFVENKKQSNLGRLNQNVPTLSENKTQPNRNLQAETKVQGPKISEVPQKSATAFDVSTDSEKPQLGGNSSTLSPRVAAAKRAPVARVVNEAGAPVAKKKCTKRNSPTSERSGKGMLSPSDASSSDDGPANEQQFFSSLKNRTPGLTITPVGPNTSSMPTSSTGTGSKTEPSEKNTAKVYCPSCKNYSSNPKWCQNCNINPSTIQFSAESEVMPKMSMPFLLTKNVTNVTVSKQIIFNPLSNADLMNQSQSFHFQQATQRKIFIKSGTMIQTPTRSKGRPRARRKFEEPVCLTLSSDEEEPMQEPFVSMPDDSSSTTFFQMESEGSKSEQSSPDMQHDDNMESDEPQFPGVTDIHPKQCEEELEYEEEEQDEEYIDELELEEEELIDEEDEEECVEDEEEEEEVPPEDEADEDNSVPKFPMDKVTNVEQPLRCRSVRIGSFKIHPKLHNAHIPIFLGVDAITFRCPIVTDANIMVPVTLKSADITCMFSHFGRCLPILFMFTTTTFAESVRKILRMAEGEYPYFDPTSTDEKEKKITFLIETMSEEHRKFFRFTFPGEKKVKELDQKTANEILVKSTPNQPRIYIRPDTSPALIGGPGDNANAFTVTSLQPSLSIIKVQSVQAVPPAQPMQSAQPGQQVQQIQPGQPIPTQPHLPVTKILTYPPPPQTGGIAITSGDLACLNESEFLNDAIIDFYLKYVFYEKLSDYHREKTHIFSSFFYPRLTHKPERPRPSEDGQKTMQVRRHSQVKTWTRHVDIFSKDYIIIPINQNKHWFLAIICYPGWVPDVVNLPTPKPEVDVSKPADNVTSTDDQEDTDKIAAIDQNSNVEGNPNNDENSVPSSNNSLYDPEESLDCEEPLPEAPDSSTHPDVNNRRKETPCICIFDSLSGPRWRLAATLREYLEMEWKMKKGTKKIFDRNTMQGFIVRCPQQTNYSDCGLYLLQYVESFFETPIPYFGNPMPDLSNWFSETKISKKRQELKELIMNLKMQKSGNSPNSNARKVNQAESVPSSPAAVQTDNR